MKYVSNDDQFSDYVGKFIELEVNGVTKKYFVQTIDKFATIENAGLLNVNADYSVQGESPIQTCDICNNPCPAISAFVVSMAGPAFPGGGSNGIINLYLNENYLGQLDSTTDPNIISYFFIFYPSYVPLMLDPSDYPQFVKDNIISSSVVHLAVNPTLFLTGTNVLRIESISSSTSVSIEGTSFKVADGNLICNNELPFPDNPPFPFLFLYYNVPEYTPSSKLSGDINLRNVCDPTTTAPPPTTTLPPTTTILIPTTTVSTTVPPTTTVIPTTTSSTTTLPPTTTIFIPTTVPPPSTTLPVTTVPPTTTSSTTTLPPDTTTPAPDTTPPP